MLITGGTGGLGSATTRALIARGARVGIVDLHPQTPEIAARISPSDVLGVTADVCDRDALQDAVALLRERFGRVDIAIANAGIMGRGSTLRAMPAPAIDKVLAVNVNGAINTVNAAMEQIVANQGQIVLISSVFAFLNGTGAIPYAMSKAAVEQLGRGLRVELAQHGASATTAYFSLIQTDMIRHGVDEDPTIAELLSRTAPRPLLKRIEPDEAAHAIVNAIEHRSPRVIRPARWTPLSVLRGVINPAIDARLAGDRKVRALLRKIEAR
ncbi:SDR family NAD(P)-dependent oxidoreductase [Streptomyces sp. NBC_01615]|uniref:SDR family NAD(P)-dependent oxidoreductase n=1 Tax=Streptomyces sp. NBC_01615 TaxID=2975898 RepID=UPI0038632BF0